ncbi:MAG: hypothetical protein AAB649_05865, partial [Patescibacteria group bacterium]
EQPSLIKGDKFWKSTIADLSYDVDFLNAYTYAHVNELSKAIADLKAAQKALPRKDTEGRSEIDMQIQALGDSAAEYERYGQNENIEQYNLVNFDLKIAALKYGIPKKLLDDDEAFADHLVTPFWTSLIEQPGREFYWGKTTEFVMQDIFLDFRMSQEIKLKENFNSPREDSDYFQRELKMPVRAFAEFMAQRVPFDNKAGAKAVTFAGYYTDIKPEDNFLPCWLVRAKTLTPLLDQEEINICFNARVNVRVYRVEEKVVTDFMLPYNIGPADIKKALHRFETIRLSLIDYRVQLNTFLENALKDFTETIPDGAERAPVILYEKQSFPDTYYYVALFGSARTLKQSGFAVNTFITTENSEIVGRETYNTPYMVFKDLEDAKQKIAAAGLTCIVKSGNSLFDYTTFRILLEAVDPKESFHHKLYLLWRWLLEYEQHLAYGKKEIARDMATRIDSETSFTTKHLLQFFKAQKDGSIFIADILTPVNEYHKEWNYNISISMHKGTYELLSTKKLEKVILSPAELVSKVEAGELVVFSNTSPYKFEN